MTRRSKSRAGDVSINTQPPFIHARIDFRVFTSQVLADKSGNVASLGDRDCSLQLHGGRVVAVAPARELSPALRTALHNGAVALTKAARYVGVGTVACLVDATQLAAPPAGITPATAAPSSESALPFVFLSFTPRLTAEHAATEEVCGIDIVQAQIRIASGETLLAMGIAHGVPANGVALLCSVTAEDPARNFELDDGVISVYRAANGPGIRLDDGAGAAGAPVTPHYDALLVKVTAHAPTFDDAVAKMTRALREHRVRGVATNLAFLVSILRHPAFLSKPVSTRFIDDHPEILASVVGTSSGAAHNRAERLLRFLSVLAVNGPDPALGAVGAASRPIVPAPPKLPLPRTAGAPPLSRPRLRDIFVKHGAETYVVDCIPKPPIGAQSS